LLCARLPGRDKAAPDETPAIDADAFFAAIVKIEARALPDARSTATLGTEREGTGVVIAKDGLVLTIGYLWSKPRRRQDRRQPRHTLPARIVAYDHVTGLASCGRSHCSMLRRSSLATRATGRSRSGPDRQQRRT
jgi:hypothetical protein